MICYPVENEDPAIKESPILPRSHSHIVEEAEAKSLQSTSLKSVNINNMQQEITSM